MTEAQHKLFFQTLLKNAKLLAQLLRRMVLCPHSLHQIGALHQKQICLQAELPSQLPSQELDRIFLRFLSRLFEFSQWQLKLDPAKTQLVNQYYRQLQQIIGSTNKTSQGVIPFLQKYQQIRSRLIFKLAQSSADQPLKERFKSVNTNNQVAAKAAHSRVITTSVDVSLNKSAFQVAARVKQKLKNYSVMSIDNDHFVHSTNLMQPNQQSVRSLSSVMLQRNRVCSGLIASYIRKIRLNQTINSTKLRISHDKKPHKRKSQHAEIKTSLDAKLAYTITDRKRPFWRRQSNETRAKLPQNAKQRVYKLKRTNLTMEEAGFAKEVGVKQSMNVAQGFFNFNIAKFSYLNSKPENVECRQGQLMVSGKQINRGKHFYSINNPFKFSIH